MLFVNTEASIYCFRLTLSYTGARPLLICEAAGHVPADLLVAMPPARAPPIGALGPSSESAVPYEDTHRGDYWEVKLFNNKDAPAPNFKEVSNV